MSAVKKITIAGAGIALGLTVLSSIAPKAQAVTFSGTTVAAPTWTRPNEGTPPSANTGIGTAVSYSSYAFNVDASGSYNFVSLATIPSAWDNYTFLYRNAFNPATPLVNAIIGNNDFMGVPGFGLSGFTTNLTAGVNYFFVTTGNTNTSVGAFTNTITGSGNVLGGSVASVPEPSTILGSALAFGYGIYSKRKLKIAQLLDVDKETD
ncbi:PEP-CTERM sorting domain-containing protein [Chamaesiphon polymorphus]|uniref:PEP-CTERM sorting domain-containing protein n=1 Tax=Chamaesiphon polymorphus CCALA 037 TaxID=2107692 RepID=A0A2T1FHA1_9CYAN|nr:PEP-CTERM sorting domain-containing protein [Chamaesiphon polymorphus]PSB44377.1 hypothetical protein C7B77_25675 [Chamaesiphon polymorphus CCALA 037]